MDKEYNIEVMLADYKDYSELFAKQIFNKQLWSEQTGCEVEEYFGYILCCENRLYDFSTWFEHTTSVTYPAGMEWDHYRAHKYSLLACHP